MKTTTEPFGHGLVMFGPHEGYFRWVGGKLQAHPSGSRGRRFVGGYLERNDNGHWRMIRTDGGS